MVAYRNTKEPSRANPENTSASRLRFNSSLHNGGCQKALGNNAKEVR